MQSTTNYQLVKQELTDRADITQISGNWDKIDTQLKKLSDEKFDKAGGTIKGKTTVSAGGLSVTGGTTIDTLTANGKVTAKGGADVTGTLTASGKITGNGGLAIKGATSLASLTTTGATIVPTPSANNHAATKKYVDDAITGKVEFNNFRLRSTVISRGTAPSTTQSLSIDFYDKDGLTNATDRLARIWYTLRTDNAGALTMGANNPKNGTAEDFAGIIAQWLADGTARISVTHHPATGSNNKSIATTYWVRSLTATTSEFGLVKLADETALLSEADDATLTVDASYELNDFRRMSTAYSLGDKVNCAFNFGVFLECTQAGTTSSETLDTRSVTHGQVISDGTVQWTVRTHVKSINGNVPDASGNVSIDTAPPIATTEEAKAGTDDTKMMTPLKTKQAIDEFAPVKTVNGEEPDESGNIQVDVESKHILGDTWISIDGSVPAGGVPFCGQIVTRALYADLYTWAQSNGKVKTESEWQSYAAANAGNCPYYSDGDGSTTFRMPCVKAYLKGATSASNAGKYEAQKLPNPDIDLLLRVDGTNSSANGYAGSKYGSDGPAEANSNNADEAMINQSVLSNTAKGGDLIIGNSIYQDGADVTPETFTVLIGVYAIGEIGNVGSADVSDILSAVAAVETEVNAKLDSSTVHIVETWRNGTEWYRKWSDGFIEQGGETEKQRLNTVYLHVPFTNTSYGVQLTQTILVVSDKHTTQITQSDKTISSFYCNWGNQYVKGCNVIWYAYGN